MKKVLIAMGLAPLIMTLVLFAFPNKAYAQDCESTSVGTVCASLVGNDVVVTLLGQEIARISAPVKEVRVQVPVPGPTQLIPVPGPTRTVSVPVPGPTKTVTIPGNNSTATAVATVTLRPTGQKGSGRDNVRSSIAATTTATKTTSPKPQATVTKSSKPKKVVDRRERKVTVTIPQAIGLSLGLLLLGLILGLLALYAAYTVGYKNSEQSEAKKWREFSDSLFGKKGKHS